MGGIISAIICLSLNFGIVLFGKGCRGEVGEGRGGSYMQPSLLWVNGRHGRGLVLAFFIILFIYLFFLRLFDFWSLLLLGKSSPDILPQRRQAEGSNRNSRRI